jgi:hypothetical protein
MTEHVQNAKAGGLGVCPLLNRPGESGDEFSPSGPNDGCAGSVGGGNERPKDRALDVARQWG